MGINGKNGIFLSIDDDLFNVSTNKLKAFFCRFLGITDVRGAIMPHLTFDYSNVDGRILYYEIIENLPKIVKIKGYKSFWPWSKCCAYVSAKSPDTVFLNTRKFGKKPNFPFLAMTIMHEIVHLCDYRSDFSFGHGNNSSVGKENTAPYYMGVLAKYFYERFRMRG
jgi:hypothetical protein